MELLLLVQRLEKHSRKRLLVGASLLNKETPSRQVILLGALDHRNVFDLRPWLLCETGGETNGSESLGLSMQRPKRTVSLLKAQTIRPAVDWA
jgi:hypothetical protein